MANGKTQAPEDIDAFMKSQNAPAGTESADAFMKSQGTPAAGGDTGEEQSSTIGKLWHAANPLGFLSDLSDAAKKGAGTLQQKSEAAHQADLVEAAKGGTPSGTKSSLLDLGSRVANMFGGLTEPKNVAIAGATIAAPEIMGPALIGHGLYGAEQAREDAAQRAQAGPRTGDTLDRMAQAGFTPENVESGLGSLAEATGGAAALGEIPKMGGVRNTLTARAGEKAMFGTPMTEAGKIAKATEQAKTIAPPTKAEPQYAQRLQEAIPDLRQIAQNNPGIKDPRVAVDAMNQRIKQIEAPIGDHVLNLPRTPENMVEDGAWRQGLDQAIQDHLESPTSDHYSGKEIDKARAAVHELAGEGPKSLNDLERLRRRLNDDAADYYKAKKAGGGFAPDADAVAAFKAAAADGIRDMMYGKEGSTEPGLLEKSGVQVRDANGNPMDIRALRRQVGNLIDVRNHFQGAITKAEQAGDWSAFKVAKSGPSLAAGGAGAILGLLGGGPVGAIAGIGAGELAKMWSDRLLSKNPNLNTAKMFENLRRTSPAPVPQVSVNGPRMPITPQPQFASPQGPLLPSTAPIQGPAPPPGAFDLGNIQPNRTATWQQQVGRPPELTWGGPTLPPAREVPAPPAQPFAAPVAPAEAPFVPPRPIAGEQPMLAGFPPPPPEASLFHIPVPSNAPISPWQAISEDIRRPVPELPQVGGKGREGVIGRIPEPNDVMKALMQGSEPIPPRTEPGAVMNALMEGSSTAAEEAARGGLKLGKGEDLGEGLGTEHTIEKDGKRIGSVTVEPRENGVLHIHWLGGEFNPKDIRGPLVEELRREYPDTKEITYDRRRVTKASEPKTEARSQQLPEKKTPKPGQ